MSTWHINTDTVKFEMAMGNHKVIILIVIFWVSGGPPGIPDTVQGSQITAHNNLHYHTLNLNIEFKWFHLQPISVFFYIWNDIGINIQVMNNPFILLQLGHILVISNEPCMGPGLLCLCAKLWPFWYGPDLLAAIKVLGQGQQLSCGGGFLSPSDTNEVCW